MATVHVDPAKVHEFEDAQSFYQWLGRHHDREDEVWIKLHKVGSGLKSIGPKEAIDVVLCWGWIDGVRKSYDASSYLQRYSPRGPRSIWSRINVDNVARLVREGRMTEHGLKPVEQAKADGRWDRAYASGQDLALPEDLLRAIEAEPRAKRTLAGLNAQNRFALAFRLHHLKTEAGRQRKIAAFVRMLKDGETLHPQARPVAGAKAAKSEKSAKPAKAAAVKGSAAAPSATPARQPSAGSRARARSRSR